MKTAVVGANGFIGSRIVETFYLADGPAVVPVTHHATHSALPARFAVDLRVADAGDEDTMATALAGCAAAVFAVRSTPSDRKQHVTNFCRAASRAGLRRVVLLSSAAIHGSNPAADTSEKSRVNPTDLDEDSAAHLAAEKQLLAECRRHDIAAFIVRPAFVYGPRSAFVAELVEDLRTEQPTLLGDGSQVLNAAYVDNVVAAVRLCLRSKLGAGQPFIISDAETVSWRDFLRDIARDLDLPMPRSTAAPAWSDDTRTRLQQSHAKLASTLAHRLLGYTPVVPLPEAIRRTCAWVRFAEGEHVAAA